jgi:hypothetical protein
LGIWGKRRNVKKSRSQEVRRARRGGAVFGRHQIRKSQTTGITKIAKNLARPSAAGKGNETTRHKEEAWNV